MCGERPFCDGWRPFFMVVFCFMPCCSTRSLLNLLVRGVLVLTSNGMPIPLCLFLLARPVRCCPSPSCFGLVFAQVSAAV
jgi:hypothetical protein